MLFVWVVIYKKGDSVLPTSMHFKIKEQNILNNQIVHPAVINMHVLLPVFVALSQLLFILETFGGQPASNLRSILRSDWLIDSCCWHYL
jgi:hypothetical protein